jgi:hypothetical protein
LLSPIWVIEKRKKDVSFVDRAIVETWTDQVLTSLMVKEVFFRGKCSKIKQIFSVDTPMHVSEFLLISAVI